MDPIAGLHLKLSNCKQKLPHVAFISIEFQKKEQDNKGKGRGKKRGLEEQVHLTGVESGSKKKKKEIITKVVKDKQHQEGDV